MPTRRRLIKWLLATGAVATSGAALVLPRKANAYYSGPVTDHFDGQRFFNPSGPRPKGLDQVLGLYLREQWAKWPLSWPSPFADKPPAVMDGQRARVALVGHASWLIQAAGRNILVDPHWSDRASPVSFAGPRRINAPGIAFDDLPRIDVVIVTHNHYDHLDAPTLGRLWQRYRPRLITPLGNDTIIRGETGWTTDPPVDWGDQLELGGGLAIKALPTQHWSARGARDRYHALWASFLITTPAGAIYAVGDSGFGDGRIFREVARAHPSIRLALLPIGAYEPRWFMAGQHMNPADSVAAFELCGAREALGHHWGTFQLTTEPHDDPPAALATALAAKGINAQRFRPMRPGQFSEISAP